MNELINTTYYPAIMLRKRWCEALRRTGTSFDLEAELCRAQRSAPLCSAEVTRLEWWSAGHRADQAAADHSAGASSTLHPIPVLRHRRLPGLPAGRDRRRSALRHGARRAHAPSVIGIAVCDVRRSVRRDETNSIPEAVTIRRAGR
jgi:hypothetical protein